MKLFDKLTISTNISFLITILFHINNILLVDQNWHRMKNINVGNVILEYRLCLHHTSKSIWLSAYENKKLLQVVETRNKSKNGGNTKDRQYL